MRRNENTKLELYGRCGRWSGAEQDYGGDEGGDQCHHLRLVSYLLQLYRDVFDLGEEIQRMVGTFTSNAGFLHPTVIPKSCGALHYTDDLIGFGVY